MQVTKRRVTELRSAERRIVGELRRRQRERPLQPELRIDVLLRAVRDRADRRPAGHRGRQPVLLGDRELIALLGDMAARGVVRREGRRVQLAAERALDPELARRVDRFLADLGAYGASPPRVEQVARRAGVPPPILAQLRDSGRLVVLAPGIEYPSSVLLPLRREIERMAASAPLSVARVRDALHTSRRHAAALIADRNRDRDNRPVE